VQAKVARPSICLPHPFALLAKALRHHENLRTLRAEDIAEDIASETSQLDRARAEIAVLNNKISEMKADKNLGLAAGTLAAFLEEKKLGAGVGGVEVDLESAEGDDKMVIDDGAGDVGGGLVSAEGADQTTNDAEADEVRRKREWIKSYSAQHAKTYWRDREFGVTLWKQPTCEEMNDPPAAEAKALARKKLQGLLKEKGVASMMAELLANEKMTPEIIGKALEKIIHEKLV
jgi:hypothetical protein